MRRLLITAGPTHEPIDAVRYIANRSSGRMGVALAEAAARADWSVTLLLGPGCAAPAADVHTLRFESTADLGRLLEREFPNCDVLVMAAAVADYRAKRVDAGKLPRDRRPLTLELEPTPDLVAACAARKRPDQRIIGFALEEPGALIDRARTKLAAKGLDAVVANPLATMGSNEIAATVILPDGKCVDLCPAGPEAATTPSRQLVTKDDFAARLIDWLEELRC